MIQHSVFFALAWLPCTGYGRRSLNGGNFAPSTKNAHTGSSVPRLALRHRSVLEGAPRSVKASPGVKSRSAAAVMEIGEVPKRRIALLVEPTPFTYVSGYKNRFQTMIRYLKEAGDEILVITTGPDAPTEFEGAKVVESPTFYNAFSPCVPETWGLSPRVWRELRDFKPDLIHSTTPATLAMTSAVYARRLGVPLVLSYHTNLDNYIRNYCGIFAPLLLRVYWSLMSMTHSLADLNLGTSPQAAIDLQRYQWSGFKRGAARGMVLNATQVWAKGVDSDVFHPRYNDVDMRSKLTDGHPNDPLIVYVGRLGPEKNLYAIKDVVKQLHETHGIDARLAIVGDGPELEQLKKHYEGTRTVFPGSFAGEELSKAYASADVFYMPSESETLGFVVLEAMSSETPVVAVRAGGIPDIIQKEGEVAYLYSPGDYTAAAGLVARLLRDKTLRERIGRAGREEVTQFDWRAATLKLRRQYSDAIELHKYREGRRRVKRNRFRAALASLLAFGAGRMALARR